jgi:DNA end-binding protein Ku
MSGERKVDLHFRMLDSRDKNPIRFERVNAETGEEVPWKDIVKAFEYSKGNYVTVEKEDIQSAAPESHESVEVEAFVDAGSIDVRFFEKPYILVPGKKAEKGYVLLRETLRATGKVGIARVVIRTREYLSAVLPQEDALVLILLRYPQELVALDDYTLPSGKAADYRISAKETEMAAQLIDSMSGKWDPASYHDEFRERLQAVIQKRIKAQEGTAQVDDEADTPQREDAATNVVDFMSLLQKSLDAKRRTPAKKAEAALPVSKTAKKPARKAAKKAAKPAAKSASKAKPAKKTAASKAPARRKAG